MDERAKIVARGVHNVRSYQPSWRLLKRPKRSPLRLFKEGLVVFLVPLMFGQLICGEGPVRWLIAAILLATSCALIASRP